MKFFKSKRRWAILSAILTAVPEVAGFNPVLFVWDGTEITPLLLGITITVVLSVLDGRSAKKNGEFSKTERLK